MANGCSQVHGLDYDVTLSPIVRLDSIRLVLAIVSSKQWKVHHMDVRNAFIHGDLEEYIYMKQPEGYTEESSLLRKLRKSLYGMKQSPWEWYFKKDAFLLS